MNINESVNYRMVPVIGYDGKTLGVVGGASRHAIRSPGRCHSELRVHRALSQLHYRQRPPGELKKNMEG